MAHVKPGVVILPIILTQDETTQDNGGRRMLKPMYAQFGTLRVGQRNQKWGRVCVGFLPLPNKNHRPQGMAKEEWQRQKRAIFQNAMDIMLADVRRYEDTGVVMQLGAIGFMFYTNMNSLSVVLLCVTMYIVGKLDANT